MHTTNTLPTHKHVPSPSESVVLRHLGNALLQAKGSEAFRQAAMGINEMFPTRFRMTSAVCDWGAPL